MIYFIIGYKNSGKTTFGQALSEKLRMEFLDLDEYMEKKEGATIPQIYSRLGEDKFRHLEWNALKEVVHRNNLVVSTGGGAPCNCDNMNLMEKYGEIIYLNVGNTVLIERLKAATRDRPIVLGKTEEELEIYLNDLRNRCEHHYRRAKYVVDGEHPNPDKVAAMLKR
jgi:shikimate kinase